MFSIGEYRHEVSFYNDWTTMSLNSPWIELKGITSSNESRFNEACTHRNHGLKGGHLVRIRTAQNKCPLNMVDFVKLSIFIWSCSYSLIM